MKTEEQDLTRPGSSTGADTLHRVLTWREGASFTVAAVLGSGILILPAVTAKLAGPASLIAWGLMALLIMPLALVLGRLSTAFPHPGGIAGFSSHASIALATVILVASVLLNILEVEISGRTVVMVVRGISAILLLAVITAAPHVRLQNFPRGWARWAGIWRCSSGRSWGGRCWPT